VIGSFTRLLADAKNCLELISRRNGKEKKAQIGFRKD